MHYIACTNTGHTAHVLSVYDGSPVWVDNIQSTYEIQYVSGLLWIVDMQSNLWAVGVTTATPNPPYIPTPSPEGPETPQPVGPKGGVDAGTIVGIVFGIFFCIGAVAGAGYFINKRKQRRGGYNANLADDGYGSVTM